MKTGILLINLGSPKEPTIPAIREYLSEFLMDPYVLQMPTLARKALVYGIILPFRPKKTLHNYKKIWTEEGSPLVVETRKLTQKLSELAPQYEVEFAMRYGLPSFSEALEKFRAKSISRIQVIPLYPQYALSTTETTIAKLNELNAKKYSHFFTFNILKDFYNSPLFTDSVSSVIERHLDSKKSGQNKWQHIIFSYHGLPKSHLGKKVGATICSYGDCCNSISKENCNCYRAQCFETTRMITKKLNIPENQYTVSFQSRLTRGWIEPFTDKIIEELPKKGIKNLAICCPSFTSDCLETLEEVQIGERKRFLDAGGETFQYIPCVNDDSQWVKNLLEIIKTEMQTHSRQEAHQNESPSL